MPELSLLGVFAHPDDEQIMTGTFAKAAAEGMRTGLICATRGEAGQISDPSLATIETIGQVREGELRAAAVVAGIKHLWFLDYRDSGWIGAPDNDNPASFYRTDPHEALGKIVKLVREFKPTVMVTFDPTGGYGHLDHLTAYKLTTEAFSAAADPQAFSEAGEAWQTARLYYSSFPRSTMARVRELIARVEPESDFLALDLDKFGLDDAEITNSVDVHEWADTKDKSLRQHRTQARDYDRWSKMPSDLTSLMRGTEHFSLAAGIPLPDRGEAKGDLFAGLRGDE